MIKLERWEAALVLLSAISARNTYGIKILLEEYCTDHDLDFKHLNHEAAVMLQSYGLEYLERKRDDRLHVTDEGYSFLINNIDFARALAVRINDVLAMLALATPLAPRSQSAEVATGEAVAPQPTTYSTFEAAFSREENRSTLCRMLRRAYDELNLSTSNNAQVAQAKAYIECALMMTECPEPQPDLVWEFCQRAGNIAGVGSLILAIIALMVAG